jgi:hypothetical protein
MADSGQDRIDNVVSLRGSTKGDGSQGHRLILHHVPLPHVRETYRHRWDQGCRLFGAIPEEFGERFAQ